MRNNSSTRVVVCRIAVGLQNAFELPEEPLRTFAPAPHPEVEDDTSSWRSILPKVGLVIFPALVVHLHRNQRLVGLNVTSGEQFPAYRRGYRYK